jgi:hypothetical protein
VLALGKWAKFPGNPARVSSRTAFVDGQCEVTGLELTRNEPDLHKWTLALWNDGSPFSGRRISLRRISLRRISLKKRIASLSL